MKELLHLPRDWMRKARRAGRQHFFPALEIRSGNLKVPAALLLDSVWRAAPGHRMKLVRRLMPYLSGQTQTASSQVCEIKSLEDFESGYARLAVMLGRAGATPPPGEIEFLRTIVYRGTQYSGTIDSSDYFFLTAFVSILSPRRVVELGTLTGFSAALIAAALQRQPGAGRWVDTIDLAPQCFIDKTRPTGFEIAERFPEVASMIRLHVPHDSSLVSHLAEPDELDLVFIDANHQHPFPLLDLLRVSPFTKPGGWIVLHDIQ